MTDKPTGPEYFTAIGSEVNDAFATGDLGERIAALLSAQVEAQRAHIATQVMIAGLIAEAHNIRDRELEVWQEVIPGSPLTECWGKEVRRPECAERHTDDCDYADPVPEPPHELLPIGTRVLVGDRVTRYPDGRMEYHHQPQAAKIIGYDSFRSKYELNTEKFGGGYHDFSTWAFADNRVQVHPEQDGAIAGPTGPRVYVQNHHGKQGHVVEFRHNEGKLRVLVQWYAPGAEPVWRTLDTLTIIASEDVDRCAFGQTADECGEGENQCEQCLAAEDAEAEAIEESMGLRSSVPEHDHKFSGESTDPDTDYCTAHPKCTVTFTEARMQR